MGAKANTQASPTHVIHDVQLQSESVLLSTRFSHYCDPNPLLGFRVVGYRSIGYCSADRLLTLQEERATQTGRIASFDIHQLTAAAHTLDVPYKRSQDAGTPVYGAY